MLTSRHVRNRQASGYSIGIGLRVASPGTKRKDKMKRVNIAELYRTEPERACRLALRRTEALPERERLEEIDKLLGNFGVEAIRGEWQNGYWCDIVAAYSNTGDTYALTVVQVRGDWSGAPSRFMVTSWGDWVERHGDRYQVA